MHNQVVLFAKKIILAKEQLDHSYTFWTMADYDISPSSKFCATASMCNTIHFDEDEQDFIHQVLQLWNAALIIINMKMKESLAFFLKK